MTRCQLNGEAQRPSPALAACVLFAVSCGGAEQGNDIALVPHAESVMPLSRSIDVLLADENTVCTTESYEYRVYCTDVNGSMVGYFGRQGDGPGELRDRGPDLLRRPDGTIGAIDSDLNRMLCLTGLRCVRTQVICRAYFNALLSTFSSTLTAARG